MVEMNATVGIGSTQALASLSPGVIGWLTTIIVFIAIIGTIFLLSKNFRRFLYGAGFTTVALIIYCISRWVGTSTGDGDYIPITGFAWVIGFIVASVIIGYFISKMKKVQAWEKKVLK